MRSCGSSTSYGPQMLRVAQMYASTRVVAEEVVQETWLAVLGGLDRFEARSSLKTWIFRILTNRAKTRGIRERRTVPFSSLADAATDDGPAIDASHFEPRGTRWGRATGPSYPPRWSDLPEERLSAPGAHRGRRARHRCPATEPEGRDHPPRRRGMECGRGLELLDLSEGNQRVLLHRARSRVRQALERELDG